MESDHLQNFVPRLGSPDSLELAGQVEIVPAVDAVPDEAVAALGDFLGFLFRMFDPAWIADRNGPCETVRESILLSCFSIACRNST
ncbi:MAG: hypothetical protein OXI81_03390 [Paracoccaceae bacterium]|nr:hypothetical protein [Paracoccaceae bacterium]MDE2914970.1 hypothetical protein [Paracoccaceae bacterium]